MCDGPKHGSQLESVLYLEGLCGAGKLQDPMTVAWLPAAEPEIVLDESAITVRRNHSKQYMTTNPTKNSGKT